MLSFAAKNAAGEETKGDGAEGITYTLRTAKQV